MAGWEDLSRAARCCARCQPGVKTTCPTVLSCIEPPLSLIRDSHVLSVSSPGTLHSHPCIPRPRLQRGSQGSEGGPCQGHTATGRWDLLGALSPQSSALSASSVNLGVDARPTACSHGTPTCLMLGTQRFGIAGGDLFEFMFGGLHGIGRDVRSCFM